MYEFVGFHYIFCLNTNTNKELFEDCIENFHQPLAQHFISFKLNKFFYDAWILLKFNVFYLSN